MWLLDTTTLELKEFFGSSVPRYAILSHTWEDGEVLFHELQSKEDGIKQKPGYRKIESFCAVARRKKYAYAWVDSCCIDKRSSAELTEAINSMFKWYRNAGICIIYLADVAGWDQYRDSLPVRDDLKKSRWFTRGWTMQELIANTKRYFFTRDWSQITDDEVECDLLDLCSTITGIPEAMLQGHINLDRFCIATRMSWAAHRETTRPEDRAYSLMGIFKVSLSILYGEGLHGAFRRLQDEIMKRSFDQTLFAWRGPYRDSGLLAHSPSNFAETPELGMWTPEALRPFSMTNVGLLIQPKFWQPSAYPTNRTLVALHCSSKLEKGWMDLVLNLRSVPGVVCVVNGKSVAAYRRVDCNAWEAMPRTAPGAYNDCVVLEDEHMNLASDAYRSSVDPNGTDHTEAIRMTLDRNFSTEDYLRAE